MLNEKKVNLRGDMVYDYAYWIIMIIFSKGQNTEMKRLYYFITSVVIGVIKNCRDGKGMQRGFL